MTSVIVKHEVKDYDTWRKTFDSVKDLRRNGGEKVFKIFRDKGNPNVVFGVFTWESDEKARQYFDSRELREKMAEAGVKGKPAIYFVDEI